MWFRISNLVVECGCGCANFERGEGRSCARCVVWGRCWCIVHRAPDQTRAVEFEAQSSSITSSTSESDCLRSHVCARARCRALSTESRTNNCPSTRIFPHSRYLTDETYLLHTNTTPHYNHLSMVHRSPSANTHRTLQPQRLSFLPLYFSFSWGKRMII